jgi:hypothetical protein
MSKACERGVCDDGHCTCQLDDTIQALREECAAWERRWAALRVFVDVIGIATLIRTLDELEKNYTNNTCCEIVNDAPCGQRATRRNEMSGVVFCDRHGGQNPVIAGSPLAAQKRVLDVEQLLREAMSELTRLLDDRGDSSPCVSPSGTASQPKGG